MIILLTFILMISHASCLDETLFKLYDDLRTSNVTQNALFDDSNYVGRNLHRVDVSGDEYGPEYGTNSSVVLCHVPTFLRYSNGPDCTVAYAASAGAILGMHHFNTGNGAVIPELKDIHERCEIRLTTEVVDTESSPINAVRAMTRMLTRPSKSVEIPQPCAVLGSQISSVTSKLASLTGVFDLFQVSSSAMDTELENDIQYPLLARSHTDVSGFGEMSISYLKNNLGISHFCLLVPQDSYGLAFQKSVLEAAQRNKMTSVNSQYLSSLSGAKFEDEIRGALEIHEQSRCNYFIGAFYPEKVGTILGIAGEMGLAGPGKFWLLSGTADTAPYLLSGKFMFKKDSAVANAVIGSGIIFCKGGLPGIGGSYDRFSKAWKELGESAEALGYVNSKQPRVDNKTICNKESGYFQNFLPHHIVTFTYDAVVALGLSACAAAKGTDNNVFTAKAHRDEFANGKFRGASGDFLLREKFPTRTADSSYFVMVNTFPKEVNSTHISIIGSPVSFFWETSDSSWEQFGDKRFVYADGTHNNPDELIPIDIIPEKGAKSYMVLIITLPLLIALIAIAGAFTYVKQRYNQADSIWNVQLSELNFNEPPTIIGRGTFGLVLLAEYRGTEVAVKRVIPAKETNLPSREIFHSRSSSCVHDIEAAREIAPRRVSFLQGVIREDSDEIIASNTNSGLHKSTTSGSLSENVPLRRGSMGSQSVRRGSIGSQSLRRGTTSSINSSVSKRSRSQNSVYKFISTFGGGQDEHTTLRKDFVREMRLLSKLRHPCITTVMGAVLDGVHEPMLVMEYMDHGSLHDILHNMTIYMDGELILPLLKDISQGVRFLHSATPKVIHGDLKSANVLVDGKFRAKVADFGLSQKKKMGASGTPYWMSPELLRDNSQNTSASDVYSFGMILYETLSRKNPYEGENYAEVIKGVMDPMINKRPPIPSKGPPQLHSLMSDCLVYKPETRPNFVEIDQRLKRLDDEFESGEGNLSIRSLQQKKDRTNRTNELLFDVFPKPIAEALRDGRKVEPTVRDIVTLFFSDIVGFTTISSSLPPIKISDMLDRLYNAFDDLSHKHGIFKVETIGDAYMAVTNLVQDQPDHAKRIADFAVDVMEAANKTMIDVEDPSKGFVTIRVGFHSGPVVANVVGSRNPRYCLFGDTVNTASRMESNSAVNRIHCSERSAKCLQEQHPSMPLLSRGWIKVKGKGEMKTFWVNESKPMKKASNGTNPTQMVVQVQQKNGE